MLAGSPECCSEKTVDGDKYSMTIDWVVSDNSSCFEKKSIGDRPEADKVKQKSCDSQEPQGEYLAIAWEFGFFTMSDPYLQISGDIFCTAFLLGYLGINLTLILDRALKFSRLCELGLRNMLIECLILGTI